MAKDDWGQDARVVAPASEDWGHDARLLSTDNSEPGWFLPGSKSEAALRGLAQAATLGLGNPISALARSATVLDRGANEGYWDSVKRMIREESAANAAAQETNPGSYLAGSVVGGLVPGTGVGMAATAGKTLGGAVGRGAAAGAGLGAVRGAADSIADTGNMLPNVGKNAAIGAIGGAASGALTNYAGNVAGDRLVSALKGEPVTKRGISDYVSYPTAGALGGMMFRNFGPGNEDISWARDPYSAAVETGVAGAKGAALGATAKTAGNLMNWGGRKAAEIAGNTVAKIGTPGASEVPRGAPFAAVTGFIRQNQPPELSDDEKRKQAMQQQSTIAGRSTTNTDSPNR